MEINRIYNENCLDTMARIPDNFVDLTVTSPPYDNLRDYKDGVGESWNFETFKPIAKELYRITKEGGVVVWVVGDATIDGSESLTSFKQAIYFREECGFNLHDTMIYEKNNFSNPSNNRYHQIFEYMFILSKGKPKTFNPIKDKKNAMGGQTNWGQKGRASRNRDGSFTKRDRIICNEYGMRTNIFRYITTYGFAGDIEAYQHPAVFPEKLAKDHILSWSNEGDLVYDCFMGSGTTMKMAIQTNRNWIGSEISSEYCKIAEERKKTAKRLF